MKKLLVQIPCLNEEINIKAVIESIPRSIPGFERVDVLLIDDGSSDNSVTEAIDAGVDVVISAQSTRGLAQTFELGLEFSLAEGYDVMVNTDGDNQYYQDKIPLLIKPIADGLSDIVIGDRVTSSLSHFSRGKKIFQSLGSLILGAASNVRIRDGASGFRAYSRFAMSKLFIATKFSYAMEVLIQAGNKGLAITHVSTGAKRVARPSRLFRSSWQHVRLSSEAIISSFLLHRPGVLFGALSLILALGGTYPFLRYLILILNGTKGDNIQSLILGVILLIGSFLCAALAVIAQLLKRSRELKEFSMSEKRLEGKPLQTVLEARGYALIHDIRVQKN